MPSNGVDLSDDQAGLELSSLAGLDFVIAKAVEGLTTDGATTYAGWAAQAEEVGAQFGAYAFFHPELLNARAQSDYFCTKANPRSGLSLWIDYETYGASGAADAEELGLFIDQIKVNVGNQQKVGIYANGTGLARILPYLAEIPFNGFWWANPSVPMTTQSTGLEWQIHQYESLNNIDRDYSTWTPGEFATYWQWS
jgi:GH25 family lysozyme M1 (1,4-beta-N-acetylmuramidase)